MICLFNVLDIIMLVFYIYCTVSLSVLKGAYK